MLLIIVVFGKLFLQCRKLSIWRRKPFYETYKDRPELSTLLREKKEYESLLRISYSESYVHRYRYQICTEHN